MATTTGGKAPPGGPRSPSRRPVLPARVANVATNTILRRIPTHKLPLARSVSTNPLGGSIYPGAKGARNDAPRRPRSSPRSTKTRPWGGTGAQCRRREAGGHPQGAHKVIISIGVAPSSSKRYPNEGSRDAPGAPNRAPKGPQSKPKIDHKSPPGATGAQWRRRRAARHPQEAPDRHPVDLCRPLE